LPNCSVTACAEYGAPNLTTTLTAGTVYTVVVDGFSGTSGAFTITATCQ
jgi:hypothetical protein